MVEPEMLRPFGTVEEERDEDKAMSRTFVADWKAVQNLIRAAWIFGGMCVAGTWVVAYTLFQIQAAVGSQQESIDKIRADMTANRANAEAVHERMTQARDIADRALDAKITTLDARVDGVVSEAATTKEAIAGLRQQMSTGFSNVDGDLGVIQRQIERMNGAAGAK